MLDILYLNECKNVETKFGGKAIGLSLLNSYGYNIPYTLAIEATNRAADFDDVEFQSTLRSKLDRIVKDGIYYIAIRSSSLNEDSFLYSLAGNYKTIIGKKSFSQIIIGMKEVVNSLNNNNDKMGIVLQELVNATYSGVAFSSNPLSFSKKEMLISFISGIGERLVSGKESGTDIVVEVHNDSYSFSSIIPKELIVIKELCVNIKKLEYQLNYPIDIEWALDKNNTIVFLQCRPISNITSVETQFIKVGIDTINNIPEQIKKNDKISLRLLAQKRGIHVSNAYLYVQNNSKNSKNSYVKTTPIKDNDCIGYSSVVIYPDKISNKIVRSFIGEKNTLDNKTMGCCRYGIRSFPEYDNVDCCIKEFSNMCCEDYWVSAVILQEIFDPLYTGVIKQNNGEYIIEITKGHFLTKGVVPTSQYVLNKLSLVSKHEIEQKRWFRIFEGHIIECVCNEKESNKISLSFDELLQLVECFSQLLTTNSIIIEFGIIKNSSNDFKPYLIDFIDNNKSENISTVDLRKGILSKGKREGVICHVSIDEYDSLNIHYYDSFVRSNSKNESIVFFCKKPDIGLLDLLNQYDESNISFVFAEGSILCHFAVLLREKNIPAIIIGDFQRYEYHNGAKCIIDAEKPDLVGKERVIIE